MPEVSRFPVTADLAPPMTDEYLFKVVDALDEVARETGKTIPQVALNWLLQRPTVSTVIVGARNEEQLRQNLGAVGWKLDAGARAQARRRERPVLPYPYWHQRGFKERNPPRSDSGARLPADGAQGRAVLRLDVRGRRGADPEVADDAVLQPVDPSVHGQGLAPLPGVAHDGRLADVAGLLDHVELAQEVRAQGFALGRVHARGVLLRDVLHVADPVVREAYPVAPRAARTPLQP
jgi:hypothetical protein